MSDSDIQKPGESPEKPGTYTETGSRGGKVPEPRVVKMPPGDKPLPPTQKPGRGWRRTGK
jgi:hypothetical protein